MLKFLLFFTLLKIWRSQVGVCQEVFIIEPFSLYIQEQNRFLSLQNDIFFTFLFFFNDI